ncbi:G-protein coupled receptor 4-like [Menidia menidia]
MEMFRAHSSRYGCYGSDQSGLVYYAVTLSVVSVGLPLTLVAIYAVYSLIHTDNVAPVYLVNLLTSDLIQLCSLIALATTNSPTVCDAFLYVLQIGMMVSICFMVVIAMERYLVVAWPLWYRFRRSLRTSVVVCLVVWALPLLYLPIFFFASSYMETTIASFLLLPFPLLLFFLGGTLRALAASRSVAAEEKRRIVASLVLVLLIYALLFLPRILFSLASRYRGRDAFQLATVVPVYFSPLADLVLYVFLRRGFCDRLLASLCCCRMEDGLRSEDALTGSSEGNQKPEQETKDTGGV